MFEGLRRRKTLRGGTEHGSRAGPQFYLAAIQRLYRASLIGRRMAVVRHGPLPLSALYMILCRSMRCCLMIGIASRHVKRAVEEFLEPYESIGRSNQKRRTRAALKEAAAGIMRTGSVPTMAEVAERAGISRATAYRYFPSQDALVAEVLLDETVRPGLAAVYEAAHSSEAADERLDAVVRADHRLVTENEAAFRTAIRTMMLSNNADGRSAPSRPGNRLRYLLDAVRPVTERLGPERTERLVTALSLCVGLESLLVTKDVCGLGDKEAGEAKRWAAAALLRAALAEVGEAG